ncbi:MAG: 4Fe-4S dicluster domain-containing protein [Deltaproteobacteria bacterium]|nr:4Fe-4S dicluster domain-containing protein [Deltaproteobacteria bacterium]
MLFHVSLYASLLVFLAGCAYKIYGWFARKVDTSDVEFSASRRFVLALGGMLGTLFSPRVLVLFKVFLLDVILQRRILKEDVLRWVMHMCIYGGFMLLLLMHALGSLVTANLFEEYASTLNPYFFLRDFFGIVVLVGVAIAVYRRFILGVPRLSTGPMDVYALVILALIMLSGVLLEGVKMTSYSAYDRMVQEYADTDDPAELKALEAYWVHTFGIVSPKPMDSVDSDLLEQGRELHEMSCMACHDAPGWAFSGYLVAKAVRPMALFLDGAGFPDILWYIHFLSCFFGLAYLPFSKMFHIIATPCSLLANAVMDSERSHPANVLTRQVMELDACTRCGTCSLRCSAVPMAEATENRYLLPAEKMAALKDLVSGRKVSDRAREAVMEGVYLCTNCDRCTVVCPSGINLRELWLGVKSRLLETGYSRPFILSPFSYAVSLPGGVSGEGARSRATDRAKEALRHEGGPPGPVSTPLRLGEDRGADALNPVAASSFTYCFGCQACTASCPVVAAYDRPEEALDLLPHQIMCSLALGLVETAAGSRMIWDCLTCYKCQEYCPQLVRIADIFFELKNLAARELEAKAV